MWNYAKFQLYLVRRFEFFMLGLVFLEIVKLKYTFHMSVQIPYIL